MNIGFIGLGNMGAPMAINLAEAGHKLTGFDTSKDAVDKVADKIPIAPSLSSTVENKEIVITMLPDGKALVKVAEEILPIMEKNSCFIDCSTVDISTTKMVAKMANEQGLFGLDAPVSGGVTGAIAGTLTFMVGGSKTSYSIGEPLFNIMGTKTIHCGDSGAGQTAKICNNMILGVTMIATCEAFALADNFGLDRQKLFDVVSTSSGFSWAMNVYCPAPGVGPKTPADNDYKPGFSAALMYKDLKLSQKAAKMTKTDTKSGELACRIYGSFVEENGGADRDFSAIIKTLSQGEE